jgi:hypothetical protein
MKLLSTLVLIHSQIEYFFSVSGQIDIPVGSEKWRESAHVGVNEGKLAGKQGKEITGEKMRQRKVWIQS